MTTTTAPPEHESGTATPPETRVPLATKVAAGAGEAAINIGINLPKNFAFPIYNLALGVNPTLLGVALLLPRMWDAVIDPVMGTISDNTRSRWGRRRPYMLVGALLSAACILLLCLIPRGLNTSAWGSEPFSFIVTAPRGDWLYAGYLTLTSIIFYTALTLFSVPYGALTMELTSDYRERTRVMSWRTFFTYLSGFLTAWLYAIAEWDIFKDAAGNKDVLKGTMAVGILLLVVMLAATLAPTLLVREPRVAAPTKAQETEPKVGFWAQMRQTFTEPAFLLIVASYTVGFLGVIMVIGLGLYIAIYHTYGGDRGTGSVVQAWSQTLAALVGIVTVFAINRVAGRLEKRTTLVICLSISFVGGLSSWWLYDPSLPTWNLIGWLPGDARWPFHPLAFSTALIWPGLAGLLVMSNSMIADVCDLDELRTGRRREATYWAVFNWVQKSAISLALLFSGTILDAIGFVSGADKQPDSVITNMRLAFAVVVCGGVGIAAVLAASIPLSRARLAQTHVALAARRNLKAGKPDGTIT
ncbi:MAG TPA: MFS transporter [Tepidisphaeraceae bacterium]|jgi:GPH family glycoside/pentoside/hexuronide:cation symporter|nr:MFS transporter [Tepidisphaeraceae bacterium]